MTRITSLAVAFGLALSLLWVPPAATKGEVSRTVTKPKKDTPEALLVTALIAAQDKDEKRGFDTYKRLVHPERRSSAIALVQLRRYSWKRFRDQASDYVLAGTQGGFITVREEPTRRNKGTKHVRLFVDPINNKRRTYPVPIRFKRHDGQWFILSNSL
jgi:hypothetical protein